MEHSDFGVVSLAGHILSSLFLMGWLYGMYNLDSLQGVGVNKGAGKWEVAARR